MLSDLDLCTLAGAAYHSSPTWATDTAHVCRTDLTDVTIVSFRGSATLQDWLTDLDAAPCEPVAHPKLGTMPSGFLESAQSVFDAIMRDVIGQWVITGHSLGGAQARIVSALAILAGRAPARLVTFGSPRTGALGGLIAMLPGTDFCNKRDPVPGVPLGYPHPRLVRHIGVPSLLDDWEPINCHYIASYAASLAALRLPEAA